MAAEGWIMSEGNGHMNTKRRSVGRFCWVGLATVVLWSAKPALGQCLTAADCNFDGQFCTLENCVNPGPNGVCTNPVPRNCAAIDGEYCNGHEVCDEARDLCEYACVGGTVCQAGFCACPGGGGGCPGGNIGQACDPVVQPITCPGGEVCNELLDDCTQCFQNSHCTVAPELRCNLSTGECVECTLDSQCSDGDFCTGEEPCNQGTGFCDDGEDVECPFGQFCSEAF
jgi:hypothetical protein